MVAGSVFFSKHCDVMISAVHGRAHQVHRTRVHSDVFLISMLLMDRFCDKASVRSHHKTAKLRINCHISHTCRYKHFLIDFAHSFADGADVVRLLIRSVRNTDSAGKVDEFNVHARLF